MHEKRLQQKNTKNMTQTLFTNYWCFFSSSFWQILVASVHNFSQFHVYFDTKIHAVTPKQERASISEWPLNPLISQDQTLLDYFVLFTFIFHPHPPTPFQRMMFWVHVLMFWLHLHHRPEWIGCIRQRCWQMSSELEQEGQPEKACVKT